MVMLKFWEIGAFFLVFLAMVAGVFWFATGQHRKEIALCEDAIRATLKAPSTYQRIDASDRDPPYRIVYDAQNSFGVPLRGAGYCSVTNDVASWLESSDPS